MRKLFLLPIKALSAFRSPLHRGEKKDTQIHRLEYEFEDRNKRPKANSWSDNRVKKEFHLTLFDLQNKYNSR